MMSVRGGVGEVEEVAAEGRESVEALCFFAGGEEEELESTAFLKPRYVADIETGSEGETGVKERRRERRVVRER